MRGKVSTIRRLATSRSVATVSVACCLLLLAFSTGSSTYEAVLYHAGWNLVGAPEGTRYAGIDGSLYTLQPDDNDYQALTPSTPAVSGWGYWAYFPVARTTTLQDGRAFISVELPARHWVLVGNPSGLRTAPVSGADALYTWDPERGYQAAASLLPGQGAWAYSFQGNTLNIGIADANAGDQEPAVEDIALGPVGVLDESNCRAGDPLAGVYHARRLQVIDPCRAVTGVVVTVKVENDGDYHANVLLDPGQESLINQRNRSIQKGALVIEVIPADQRQLMLPLVRDHVRITGAFVLDREHGWMEVHPAWKMELVSSQ